jgi:hypothetical protein
MGVGGYTDLVHLFYILKEIWWTRSEPFITRLEIKCTQQVIPSRIEHSEILPR